MYVSWEEFEKSYTKTTGDTSREEGGEAQDGDESRRFISRLFQDGGDDGDILQLQWMRLNLSGAESCCAEGGQCNKEADALKPLAPAECMVDPADLFPFRFIEMDEDANYALFPKKLEQSEGESEVVDSSHCTSLLGTKLDFENCMKEENWNVPLHQIAMGMSEGQWRIWLNHYEVVKQNEAVRKLGTFLQRIPSMRLADCLLSTTLPNLASTKGVDMDGLAELCTAIVEHGRLAKLSPIQCRHEILSMELNKLGKFGAEAEVFLAEAYNRLRYNKDCLCT